MRTAIVTLTVGESYRAIGRITHPLMREYADRIKSEFIVVGHSDYQLHHFDKIKIINRLFGRYDRIIYLDVDIVIKKNCPNLFDLIVPEEIGIYDEKKYATPEQKVIHDQIMKKASKEYNIPLPSEYSFYNTGVMVLSKKHVDIFQIPSKTIYMEYGEQPLINLYIANSRFHVHDIGPQFNKMPYVTIKEEPYIIHYAGLSDAAQLAKKDIETLYPVVKQQVMTLSSRLEMLDVLKLGHRKCVEVGTHRGDFAYEILRRGPRELWLIDPWEQQSIDIYADDHANKDNLEEIYYSVLERFYYDKRVRVIRDYSLNAVKQFQDESIDFVYIDAVHSMASVLIDMSIWWHKVKPGGWICGHDYTGTFPGVKVAVDEFCKISGHDLNLLCLESWASWGIHK